MHYCLTDFILELVHNAYEAKAKNIVLKLTEATELKVTVIDDGAGMTERQAQQALDPFYTEAGKHDKRRVGLGLPFVKQVSEMTAGVFTLDSTPGKGTTVRFSVQLDHIDCPPLGNLVDGLTSILAYPVWDTELKIVREKQGQQYILKRSELSEALGGFETAMEMKLLRDFIQSQEDSIQGGLR